MHLDNAQDGEMQSFKNQTNIQIKKHVLLSRHYKLILQGTITTPNRDCTLTVFILLQIYDLGRVQ